MKVSIIITSYNYGMYIERTIRSCLAQNLPRNQFEVIVIDDTSTDGTVDHIQRFTRVPNFHLICNPTNVGVAESSNIGIRAALGQFVVRVDADDYINANMTLFLSEYLEANHDAFAVACDYILIDEEENVIGRRYADREPISCGIMYRRDILVRLGLYDPQFRHLEEKELRLRLGDYYKIHYLHIPYYRYRLHGKNKTSDQQIIAAYDAKIGEKYFTTNGERQVKADSKCE